MMDPKQREKCLKEVRLLESLDHPNIIKYLDSFIEGNQLFIAIEWAEKGDLKKVIKKAISEELALEERKIWEYLYQIASALKHMQEKRIMHRDLKPANIFLGSDGTLKLGDLGLGRFMSSQTIEAFSRVGTPLYMSPEVLKGSGYEWKSDIWSLGCVIYELACLRSPFKREDEKMSLYDLFQTINKGEYPPLPSRYSEELKQIIDSMIQILPVNRLAIDQIVELCEIQLKSIVKKTRPDPYLIMDDICEKLKLLNYEKNFCKVTNRKPISRVYFAHHIEPSEQVKYFYDLCMWIMSIRNNKQPVFVNGRVDSDKLVANVFSEIKAFGVKVPDFISLESLKNGFGEAVCFVINDLLNKELIRIDYRFETPIIIENGVECYGDPPEEIVFYEEISAGIEEKFEKSIQSEEETEKKIEITEKENSDTEKNNISPEDWYAEAERVSKKLVIHADDTENKYFKIISEKIQRFKNENTLQVLESKAEEIENSLERIRNLENRMQKDFIKEIEEYQKISEVKGKINEKYENHRNQFEDLLNDSKEIKVKQKDLEKPNSLDSGKQKISTVRNCISLLKKEISQIDRKIAIARSIFDHFTLKKI